MTEYTPTTVQQRQAIAALDMAFSYFGDPNTVPINMRAEVAQSALELGYTPEDAALLLAFHLAETAPPSGKTSARAVLAVLRHPAATQWLTDQKVSKQSFKRLVDRYELLVKQEIAFLDGKTAVYQEMIAELDRL